jgi:hypothetical protein
MRSLKERWLAGALALAAVVAPGATLAQGTDSPFVGRTDEAIIRDLRAYSTNPDAARQLDAMVREMLAPERQVPDWNTKGVDVIAAVSALKGGLAGNMLVTQVGQLTISRFDGQPFPASIMAGYSTLVVRSSEGASVNQRLLSNLKPGFWIEVAVKWRQHGNALCNTGVSEVRFHTLRPAAQWTQQDVTDVAMIMGFYDQMARHEVCEAYTQVDSGFAVLSYLPDGTRIPAVDTPPQRVMPISKLPALVRGAR